MAWLDCSNLETARSSISIAVGADQANLTAILSTYDESRLAIGSEDPYKRMPREVCEVLGCDIERVAPNGAFFFHATRLLDPNAIAQQGIVPLGQIIDHIWASLFPLVSDVVSGNAWEEFRESIERGGGGYDGSLYREKTRRTLHHGPMAFLVRDSILNSHLAHNHDYLECPEIIQDIARCFEHAFAVHLEDRFIRASHPAIVKFRSRKVWTGSIRAALWYIYELDRTGTVSASANEGFDGEGTPVHAEDIVAVDLLR